MNLTNIIQCLTAIALIAAANLATAQEGHEHREHRKGHESREHGEHMQKEAGTERSEMQIQQHADKLYAAVKQARSDLREMRIKAGLHAHAKGPHIDPEGHHAYDSPEQRLRELHEADGHEDGNGHEAGGDRRHREHGHEKGHGREHRHEEGHERGHGERGHGEQGTHERGVHEHREGSEGKHGEHGNKRLKKNDKLVRTYKNGAKLTLEFNPATQAFVGKVKNTTKNKLEQVRVEIHLSNGVELGPTKRVDVKPGETVSVELGAFGQKFSHWVTHPEAGNEEEHGPDDEAHERHAGGHRGEGGGEHGSGGGGHESHSGGEHTHGPEGHGAGASSMRPVHNQIQLLRGELAAFAADLKTMKSEPHEGHGEHRHSRGHDE